MDDPATAELPARAPARPRRDARRAPAVQRVSRWTHDLDMSGLRLGGVRATADRRLPDSRWCGRGALGAHRATEIKCAVSSQRSSSSASATSLDRSGPPRSRAARRRAAKGCFLRFTAPSIRPAPRSCPRFAHARPDTQTVPISISVLRQQPHEGRRSTVSSSRWVAPVLGSVVAVGVCLSAHTRSR
jgi:hypothetical protein